MSDALRRAREIHNSHTYGARRQRDFEHNTYAALLDVVEAMSDYFETFPDDREWVPEIADALKAFEQKMREQE